jgi:hypothetical protein
MSNSLSTEELHCLRQVRGTQLMIGMDISPVLLDRLAAKGLIERLPAGTLPGFASHPHYRLTAAGEAVLARSG